MSAPVACSSKFMLAKLLIVYRAIVGKAMKICGKLRDLSERPVRELGYDV